MKSGPCFLITLAVTLLCLVRAEIVQHRRGKLDLEKSSGSKLIRRKLPYNCDFSGKKGGASCNIPSCCECDCFNESYGGKKGGGNESYGGKKGGGGQVCECACDCEGDDDDDDDDGPNPVPRPTDAPVPNPTYAPVPSPAPFPPCDVCGNGRSVNLPGVMVRVEGFGMVECGELERDGSNRRISPSECPLIPDQINSACGCNPPCNVCGNGRPVGNPNAIVKFPGEPAMRCGDLQSGGLAGSITPSECIVIPGFIRETCGCEPDPVDDDDDDNSGDDDDDDDDNSGDNDDDDDNNSGDNDDDDDDDNSGDNDDDDDDDNSEDNDDDDDDDGDGAACTGKKGGNCGSYGGKKTGYQVIIDDDDGNNLGYGGKKAGYGSVIINDDDDDDDGKGTTLGYGGKKVGYSSVIIIDDDDDDDDNGDDDDDDGNDDDDDGNDDDDDGDDDDDDGNDDGCIGKKGGNCYGGNYGGKKTGYLTPIPSGFDDDDDDDDGKGTSPEYSIGGKKVFYN